MFTTRRRAALRAATAFVAAGALVGGLTACAGSTDTPTPAESIPAEGVDDGSTLTLWTRAPMERQANLLVDAYNASHENQVELTVVPPVAEAPDANVAPARCAAGVQRKIRAPRALERRLRGAGVAKDSLRVHGRLTSGRDSQLRRRRALHRQRDEERHGNR